MTPVSSLGQRVLQLAATTSVLTMMTACVRPEAPSVETEETAADATQRVRESDLFDYSLGIQIIQRIGEERDGGYALCFDIEGLSGPPAEGFPRVLQYGPIRSFYDCGMCPEWIWDLIAELPAVESVTSRSELDAGRLKWLKELQNLETIVLGPPIHRPDRNYRETDLYPATALTPLSTMDRLKSLSLRGRNIDNVFLKGIGQWKQIEALTLDGHFSDDGLAHLAPLAGLTRLSLRGDLDGTGLATLAALPALQFIRVSCKRIKPRSLAPLADLSRLALLSIHAEKEVSLDGVAACKSLQGLTVGGDCLTDNFDETAAELPQLRSLSFFTRDRNANNLAFLDQTPNLEELSVSGMALTDKSLSRILKLRHLTKLQLGPLQGSDGAKANASSLRRLGDLPALKELAVEEGDLPILCDIGFECGSLEKLYCGKLAHRNFKDAIAALKQRMPGLVIEYEQCFNYYAFLPYTGDLLEYDFGRDSFLASPTPPTWDNNLE